MAEGMLYLYVIVPRGYVKEICLKIRHNSRRPLDFIHTHVPSSVCVRIEVPDPFISRAHPNHGYLLHLSFKLAAESQWAEQMVCVSVFYFSPTDVITRRVSGGRRVPTI